MKPVLRASNGLACAHSWQVRHSSTPLHAQWVCWSRTALPLRWCQCWPLPPHRRHLPISLVATSTLDAGGIGLPTVTLHLLVQRLAGEPETACDAVGVQPRREQEVDVLQV